MRDDVIVTHAGAFNDGDAARAKFSCAARKAQAAAATTNDLGGFMLAEASNSNDDA